MNDYNFPPGVIQFRVEPETRSLYFHVYIWPTLKTMRQYVCTYGSGDALHKGHAFTLDLTGQRDTMPRGLLGQMHFARRYMEDDYVSHECLHCVLVFARWKGIDGAELFSGTDPKSKAEERLCYALGSLCAQVTSTAERYGYR